MPGILQRQHWVFDMDGTLTVAVHDFEAMRKALNIAPKVPILEALAAMPTDQAVEKRALLDEMERETASRSTPMPGAAALLAALQQRGVRMGILTRNNHASAITTLSACGFDQYFDAQDILHRDSCTPKPAPDGINQLLHQWRAPAHDAVMVGDYLFDLQAGKCAHTATIYIDTQACFEWAEYADISIASLAELLPLPSPRSLPG